MRVLYEDNHLIAVEKRSGDIVQGDKTNDTTMIDTVSAYIKKKYNKPGNVYLGVLHRIDRPVSGVVLFGRTSKATIRMNKMMQERTIHKKYHLLTDKPLAVDRGTLIHYLKKIEAINRSVVYSTEKKGTKRAELRYQALKKKGHLTLVEVELITGRHHQIRAQLAQIGSPVLYDVKYGGTKPPHKIKGSIHNIHLHGYEMSFVHPVTGRDVEIRCPYPSSGLWHRMI